MSRVVMVVLAFLVLVGVFVLVQRDNNDASDVVRETSPAVDGFEPRAGEPRLIAPLDGQPAQSGSGSVSGAAGQVAGSIEGAPASSAPSTARYPVPQQALPPGSAMTPDGGTTPAYSSPALAPGAGSSSAAGAAMQQGGPGPMPGMDPAMPVTEMISLPPSGPGPMDTSAGFEALAPEHGSTDSVVGPEFGATQGPGPGPELLPVTQPGPAGEMPGEPPLSGPAPE